MKLLCVGRQGQVARALTEQAEARGIHVISRGRPELNILDPQSIRANLNELKPDIVLNAAAYTAVDKAESEPAAADALNHAAASNLAAISAEMNLPLVHISTDYVFDGQSQNPYVETDAVAPNGVYGQTKLNGERAVMAKNPHHIILRTAWVYSPFGTNFVKTMLRLALDREEISVVDDQIGNPTSAFDIAAAGLTVCQKLHDKSNDAAWGLYHLAGKGAVSWAGFAKEIFDQSRSMGGPYAGVRHIPTKDYPTPTKRPANSQLNCDKLALKFGVEMRTWQSSLSTVLERLLKEGELPQ